MLPILPSSVPDTSLRVRTGGKYLRQGADKWFLNGVSYGPFKPNDEGEPFPSGAQLSRDFAAIRSLGFNTVRIYELPTATVLARAAAEDLRLIVGVPWTDHVDFLRDAGLCLI
ncbi:MAG: putative glycosyltransferase, partial [Verrucomicrobiaceae bacterium]|nr:putative glycosyltransferase [Verrucomicrobiaceae bacterium]